MKTFPIFIILFTLISIVTSITIAHLSPVPKDMFNLFFHTLSYCAIGFICGSIGVRIDVWCMDRKS